MARPTSMDLWECAMERLDRGQTVRQVAAAGFERVRPKLTGRPGYDPAGLLKLCIYGYLNRINPSAWKLGTFTSALLGSIHPALTGCQYRFKFPQMCRLKNPHPWRLVTSQFMRRFGSPFLDVPASFSPAVKRTVSVPSACSVIDWPGWNTNVDADRAASASNRRTTLKGFSWNVPKDRLAKVCRSNAGSRSNLSPERQTSFMLARRQKCGSSSQPVFPTRKARLP